MPSEMNMIATSAFPSLTLPIDLTDGIKLDPREARRIGEHLSGEYCFAEPYPHIVLDNFLPADLAEKIITHFPEKPLANVVRH